MTTTKRPARILVVDEEETLTHMLRMVLELEDWEVHVARDGAAARDAIWQFAPDIILLDMMLPDTTGTELLTSFRGDGIATPVIFLTGRATNEDRLAGYAAGADGYITKPFGLEEVVDHLQPFIRQLGLAPTSHRYADLVLDDATAEVWRDHERILLTPIEFELLRAMLDEPAQPKSLGHLLRSVTLRGARVPRDLAVKMLDRMRQLVNKDRTPLVQVDSSGGWTLALA